MGGSTVMLADGSEIASMVCQAQLHWNGTPRLVYVRVVPEGEVRISALSDFMLEPGMD